MHSPAAQEQYVRAIRVDGKGPRKKAAARV
jgi:hypothetical protein